jgi:hypothetical protein
MALRSATTHLNVTREGGIVSVASQTNQPHKKSPYAAIYAERLTCHTFSYGILKQCLTSRASLRRMVTTAKAMTKSAPIPLLAR